MSDLDAIVVRINEPPDGSLRTSAKVPIKGWIYMPGAGDLLESVERLAFDFAINDVTSETDWVRNETYFPGTFLPREETKNSAWLEELSFNDIGRVVFDPVRKKKIPVCDFSGSINIDFLVPKGADAAIQYHRLTAIVRDEKHICVSNGVLFGVPPRSVWEEPKGRILFPEGGRITSDYLVIDGWALRQNDLLEEAHIFLNGDFAASATVGIWSPKQHLWYPDIEGSKHCMYSYTFRWEDIANLRSGCGSTSRSLSIRVEARFSSGAQATFYGPTVIWNKSIQKSKSSAALFGEVESVKLTEDGHVSIEGWVVTPNFEVPAIVLEGTRAAIVPTDPASGADVWWGPREDVEKRYFNVPCASAFGFTIKMHPHALGRFPGPVRLLAKAEGPGLSKNISTFTDSKKIAALVGELTGRETFSHRVKLLASWLLVGKRLGNDLRSSASKILGFRKGERERGVAPSKRVLFASHNLSDVEGAPRTLFEVVKFLRKSNPQLEIKVVAAADGRLREKYQELGVEVEIVEELSVEGITWRRYVEGITALSGVVAEFKPGLVYANVLNAFWGIDVGVRLGVKTIWAIHESVDPPKALPELPGLLRIRFLNLLRQVDKLVFVASETESLFLPHLRSEQNTSVIPNGIDCEEIKERSAHLTRSNARKTLGIDNDVNVVSIIGTTTPRKGQDVFLREMAALKEMLPSRKFTFLIVGARYTEFLVELQRLIKDYGLEDEAILVKETNDIALYYRASDVMVIASREESAPLVSLEAFAYGVPLVSTTVFGLAEQIRDGVNALSFDSSEEGHLAEKVALLLEEPSLRSRIVESAFEDVKERFDLESSLRQYQALLEQSL